MAMENAYEIKPDHSAPSDGRQVESEEQDDTFLFMNNAHDLDAQENYDDVPTTSLARPTFRRFAGRNVGRARLPHY